MSANELFDYFLHLDERDHTPETFEDNWTDISDHSFTPKQISLILKKSADLIRFYDDKRLPYYDPNLAGKLKSIIVENWDCWEQNALGNLPKFIPIDLSDALNAHTTLGIKPSQVFYQKWSARVEQTVHNFKTIDFRMHYASAARLGVDIPHKVAQEMLKRIEERGDFLNTKRKSPLLWSLAIEDSIFPHSEYRDIAHLIRSINKPAGTFIPTEKMRYDVSKWFDWKTKAQNPIQKETTSNDEMEIRKLLREAGIRTVKYAQAIAGFNQAIDFTAVLPNGREIDIEIDGPSHFNRSARQNMWSAANPPYKGTSLFRSALCRKADSGARMLRIPFPITDILLGRDKNQTRSREDHRALARSFVESVADSAHDVYRAMYNPQIKGPDEFTIAPLLSARAQSNTPKLAVVGGR